MPTAHLLSALPIREIPFGSDDYRAECALRNRVLRVPLGMDLHDEDLRAEEHQSHFGLFEEGGALIACVIGVTLSPARARIRQMAVAPEHQGKGSGRTLLAHVEAVLALRGVSDFSLHARKTAVGFYQKLGYLTTGSEFTEIGLPHVLMQKSVMPQPTAAASGPH